MLPLLLLFYWSLSCSRILDVSFCKSGKELEVIDA